MKFVSIMGPVNDIDRVREKYISKYDFQFEDAIKEVGATQNVTFMSSDNPLTSVLKDAKKHAQLLSIDESLGEDIGKDEAIAIVNEVNALLDETRIKKENLRSRRKYCQEVINKIIPFTKFEFPIENLRSFRFIKFRFGKIPITSYKQFNNYLFDQTYIIFEESYTDSEYVWGMYFVPATLCEKVDMIFASLHFVRVELPEEMEDSPELTFTKLKEEIEITELKIHDIEEEESEKLEHMKKEISSALRTLLEYSAYYDAKKYIAKTADGFYVIMGWMIEKQAKALESEAERDEKVVVILEKGPPNETMKTPTKLSNLAIFRPFEFFVKMYGVPGYNEFDPTPFFAITYSILFGMMFGDLGQGLVLSILGLIYYRRKKSPIGAILGIIGVSAAFFGAMYGSVFGYEEVFTPLWIKPMQSTMDILITTVSFGIFLNLFAMFINIFNCIRRKDFGTLLFSPNGLAGLVFYIVIIAIVATFALNQPIISIEIALIFIIIPLVLIAFKEPLSNLVNKEKKHKHGSIGLFLVETFFETFEILLSYLTNTISFVRVGAFALCHAGMMSVVIMLAGASERGGGNMAVMIIGNLFVMGLEGLVVAIQVLRLQYYEMFSRYFRGGGKEFKSYKDRKNL